jgi:hypothetical protein
MKKTHLAAAVAVCAIGAVSTVLAQRPATNMSFFVTSSNPKGGNLGGLSGGDAVCQSLAQAAGAGGKTWHAYLSSSTVDAKTRIGNGPWHNFKGELIASSVADLHSARQQDHGGHGADRKAYGPRTPRGQSAPAGRAAVAARHPHRTNEDGTKNADTCRDWTVGNADAKAMLHADRPGRNPGVNSWNQIHPSQGCGHGAARPTGGAGLLMLLRDQLADPGDPVAQPPSARRDGRTLWPNGRWEGRPPTLRDPDGVPW